MAQTVQILRTTPVPTLLPGAFSVELGSQTRLWIGSGSGNRLLFSSDPADPGAGIGVLSVTAGTGLVATGTARNPVLGLQIPVSISNGGTNAMSAPQALTNLGAAPLASPNFTGNPTAVTQLQADNSTRLATTAYVRTAVDTAPYMPIAGGTFTGIIRGPTPDQSDSSTRLATTDFTKTLVASAPFMPLGGGSFTGGIGAPSVTTNVLNVNGSATITGNLGAHDISASGALTGNSLNVANDIGVAGSAYVTGAVNSGSVITSAITSYGAITLPTAGISAVNGQLDIKSITLPDVIGGRAYTLYTVGTNSYLTFLSGYYLEYRGTTGQMTFSAGSEFWVMRPGDNLCYNNLGPVAGFGAYLNMSDRRTKIPGSIENFGSGLAEILGLQPVQFDRVKPPPPDLGDPGPDRPKEVGFIAQDVAAVLPEAVWQAGVPLPDGSGTFADPEPTLALSYDAIVATLVNAMKTIDQRLTALETP